MQHPAYDHIVFADFESYFDLKTGYSLTRMPTINYCRDERWLTLGCAVALDDEPSRYLSGEALQSFFDSVNWPRTAFAAFNCLFDGTALTQQFNIFPAYYICTLSVCRALLPIDRHTLKNVASSLGLADKLDALVDGSKVNTAGMDVYANRDNDLSRDLYKMLYPMLSQEEQDIINLTIRQGVEPVLVLDRAVLLQVRDDAAASRAEAIKASGQTEAVLNSNPQFARLVRSLGLTPPTKISEATGEETEAFSKGDDEFVSFMLKHPQYKLIWEGRLAAKSNINVTRTEKFLSIWASAPGHTTSMPLNYCGALTGRSSGADGLNVQNLPSKYKSNMRKAFTAPKGQVIVVVDSAQIELRVNFWQTGQLDKLNILRNGGCVYTAEAATQFGIDLGGQLPVKGLVEDSQRQYGKVCQLGLGFGMGYVKFMKVAAAGPMGMDPVYMTDEHAYKTVETYRANNKKIVDFWRLLQQRIYQMTLRSLKEQQGVVTFVHEGIELPSGRMLQYPGLTQLDDGKWVYGIDRKVKFLWGGSLCFTADTKCVTLRGIIPITEVTSTDLVWDGESWVTTDGVVAKGEQEVGSWLGVTVTAEHKIFDGNKWSRVMDLDASSSQIALDWARSSVSSQLPSLELGTIVLRDAFAAVENQRLSIPEHSPEPGGSFVNDAQQTTPASGSLNTQSCPQQGPSQLLGSIDTQGWLADAQTRITARIKTMVVGALQYTLRGLQIVRSSISMLQRLTGSIPQGSTLTGKTTNAGMNQGTYVSLPEAPAVKTNDGTWVNSHKEAQVFDLVNSGENHRFSIMTDNGPVVVHNCENLTQALARDIVFHQMLEIDKRYRVVSSTHDEVLYLAPEQEAEEALAFGIEVFSQSPSWAPDLPVSAEGIFNTFYSK